MWVAPVSKQQLAGKEPFRHCLESGGWNLPADIDVDITTAESALFLASLCKGWNQEPKSMMTFIEPESHFTAPVTSHCFLHRDRDRREGWRVGQFPYSSVMTHWKRRGKLVIPISFWTQQKEATRGDRGIDIVFTWNATLQQLCHFQYDLQFCFKIYRAFIR